MPATPLDGALDDEGFTEGYLPATFLGTATPEGVLLDAFKGDADSGAAALHVGDPVWRIRQQGEFVEVVTASGERWCVPSSQVAWASDAAATVGAMLDASSQGAPDQTLHAVTKRPTESPNAAVSFAPTPAGKQTRMTESPSAAASFAPTPAGHAPVRLAARSAVEGKVDASTQAGGVAGLPRARIVPAFSGATGVTTLYDFRADDANGDVVDLARYRGKVLVVINVASRCDFTAAMYGHMRELQNRYGGIRAHEAEHGMNVNTNCTAPSFPLVHPIVCCAALDDFKILAFPCNQFFGREPRSALEVRARSRRTDGSQTRPLMLTLTLTLTLALRCARSRKTAVCGWARPCTSSTRSRSRGRTRTRCGSGSSKREVTRAAGAPRSSGTLPRCLLLLVP